VTVTWVPQIAQTRFLAFGDSMTAGILSPAPFLLVDAPESYPYKLALLLAARYQDQTTVVLNDGLGGEWAQDGAARLPGSLGRTDPQVVLLWEGANELLDCRGTNDFDRCIWSTAIPGILRGLRDQVRTAKARGVKVLLATHPPQRPGTLRGPAAPWVPTLNAAIAALASGEQVTLVDLYAAFPADTTSTVGADGLHLTEAGYALVARVFLDAISSTLEVPYPSPAPFAVR
ncbi:MAG: SGNH/GDSL hydrolase family protein, partial [Acidobacteriota bacterium]